MTHLRPPVEWFRLHLLFVLAVVATTVWAPNAFAQSMSRVVVLEVGEGTRRLEAALAEVPRVEVRTQDWFVEQIEANGQKPRRLFDRPKDLSFVMVSAGVAYVVAVKKKGDVWFGAIFDDSGEPTREFEVPRGGDELSVDEAKVVRRELATVLGVELAEDLQQVETSDSDDVAVATDPAEETEAPRNEESRGTDVLGGRENLRAHVAAALIKRDFTYAGTNSAVLTYRSAFYPGARFGLGYFAFAEGALGFALDGTAGFDSVSVGNESLGIRQLEGEVALMYRTDGALTVSLGGRHARFDIGANDALPATSSTLIRLGAELHESVGPVDLSARIDAFPYGFVGNAAIFGTSALTYGFGGRAVLSYAVSDSIGLRVGTDFRLLRSDFAGAGTLDFVETRAFELVWGPDVGITLAY